MGSLEIQVSNNSPCHRSFALQKEICASMVNAVYNEAVLVSMVFLYAQHFGSLDYFVSLLASWQKSSVECLKRQPWRQYLHRLPPRLEEQCKRKAKMFAFRKKIWRKKWRKMCHKPHITLRSYLMMLIIMVQRSWNTRLWTSYWDWLRHCLYLNLRK